VTCTSRRENIQQFCLQIIKSDNRFASKCTLSWRESDP
jgi:hypothetical protein